MQGKIILIIFCLLILLTAPATASLNKIAAGAPVFIGENDVDISSSLNGCHIIAWLQNGTTMDDPSVKNVTIYELNSISDKIYHYNFSPEIFSGYSGTWYCEDLVPRSKVFDLNEPQIAIKVWDLDQDRDVTGMSISRSANVTYRIDTNLYPALKYLNRPNANPADSFFTVKLTDPFARNIPNIYTGSYGGPNTLILPFENKPYVSSSPFIWNNGKDWDIAARNIQGDPIYPPGMYTFTVTQNLNHMQDSYGAGASEGKTISSANITFLPSEPLAVPSSTVTVTPPLPEETLPVAKTPVTATPTVITTSLPVTVKTTYTPLPVWIVLLGVGIAGFLAIVRRKN